MNRGVLEGIVTDPQGAVVPNVTVTLTNVDTNVSTPTKTNSAGSFRVQDLVAGKYKARFEVSGFSTLELTDVEVPAGKVTRLDTQMKLGETTQLVEVTAEVPLVETAPTNFSTTLETRTIEEIPLAGRDLQQLVFLVPGVNNVGGPPGSNFGFNSQFGTFPDPTNTLGSNLSVNGSQAGANAWYLDGNLNLSSNAENIAVNPSPDAVQEFQVISNAFAAEYSRTGGGVFNVVLKSGTNNFHGNLYGFHRNDAFNARNPFTSIDGEGKVIEDRALRYTNFGGTVGGPVHIPGLYDGKNKTHFFFSWDTQILRLLDQGQFTVPTARMRQGDFSEDPLAAQYGIWDAYSTTGANAAGLFERRAFGTPVAGNPFGANGCLASAVAAGRDGGFNTCNFATSIPTDRLSPNARFFTDSYPLPNSTDPFGSCPPSADGFSICNNFRGPVGDEQKPHNMSIKIDHQVSEKNKFFFEYLYSPVSYKAYAVPWKGPAFNFVGSGSQVPLNVRNRIFGLGNTYSFSPTLINEFRYNFSRQFITTTSGVESYLNEFAAQDQVNAQLDPIQIPNTKFYPSPSFSVSVPGGYGLSFGPPAWVEMDQPTEAHTIMDNLTKIVGKHTFKTGFVFRLEHATWDSTNPTGLQFNGTLSSDPISGLGGGAGLAQFLQGATGNGDGNYFGLWPGLYIRWRYWGAYFQDDFRITPNFSVHLGLRWDLYEWMRGRNEPMGRFCQECINPLTGLRGQVLYEGDPGFPLGANYWPSNKNNFTPRINFSWQPSEKTVIRGGYNMMTSNAINANNFPGQWTMPGWQQGFNWTRSANPSTCDDFSGQCFAWSLDDTSTDKGSLTFPVTNTQYPAQRRDPLLGEGLSYAERPSHDPLVQMWGLEVERELPANLAISVGYVGNRGTHLFGEPFRALSYVPTAIRQQYRTAINAQIPITDVHSGQTAAKLEEVYGSPTLARSTLLRTYPFFPGVSAKQYDGTSIYHGMNVRLQKRFSHGLHFIGAYTWSKKITNASTANLAQFTVNPVAYARAGGVGGRAGQRGLGANGDYQDSDNRA
ncbi:MAG TPA: TonB-dependent receptor, partial [Terriglobia bacterium]|nr:TonB-dependent receptor [Terriglobia bacterium]